MFPRMNIANPLQAFPFGAPQYGASFGGINPYVHPLLVAQLAANNPTLLPLLGQHSAIGQSPYGVQSPLQFQPGQLGSPFQQFGQFGQFGAGIGQWSNPLGQWINPLLQQSWGQQAFGYPAPQQGFGWGAPAIFSSPVPGVDPITGALIAQQVSPLAQSQLPIRPLVTPPDPFQMAALSGVMTGHATDPYSILAQSGLIAPLGVNPLHPALRQQIGSPYTGIPI